MLRLVSTIVCLLAVAPLAHAELPQAAPTQTAAAPADVSAVLAKVQAKYGKVDVLQATFSQTSSSPLYGASEQTGRLTVQRPKRMRWDFDGEGKQFITDGATMWIYSKADNQVIRYTDFGSQAASADALLQSLDRLGELFDVSLLEGPGVRLGLVPKDAASAAQVKKIVLSLSDDMGLQEVEVIDAYDGNTRLRFDEVELGGTVPAGTFDFKVPDGAKVVDASG